MRTVIAKVLILCCTLLVIIQFVSADNVYAEQLGVQDVVVSVPDKETPILFLKGEPSRQIEATYNLTNNNKTDSITLYPSVTNFTIDNAGDIQPDSTPKNTEQDLAKWVSFAKKEIKLKQGETQKLSFVIRIPENASGGTHATLLTFLPDESSTNDSEINSRISLPIFITIAKDIDFQASIESATIRDNATMPIRTAFSSSFNMDVEINNTGNVYIIPVGDIFVYKKDRTKSVVTPFNPAGLIVQPKGKRLFTFRIPSNNFIQEGEQSIFKKFKFLNFFNFKFGTYHATYQAIITPAPEAGLTQGTTLVMERTTTFFVFPVQLLILVLILMALFVSIAVKNVKKWRKNRKYQHYKIS